MPEPDIRTQETRQYAWSNTLHKPDIQYWEITMQTNVTQELESCMSDISTPESNSTQTTHEPDHVHTTQRTVKQHSIETEIIIVNRPKSDNNQTAIRRKSVNRPESHSNQTAIRQKPGNSQTQTKTNNRTDNYSMNHAADKAHKEPNISQHTANTPELNVTLIH